MKKVIKISFLLVFIFILAFISIPRDNILIITETDTGKILRYFHLEEEDEFILSFTHSINKRPVYEYIKNHDGLLVVYKARYDAFGAGMPETSVDGLKITMKENGIIELTNINRQMDEFSVFVGTVANHKIAIHGEEIPLNTISQPGESLTFKLTNSSYLNLWKEMI